MIKENLFIIPARGGSKGIPGKNIKNFGGKPLICYAIDQARTFVKDEDICVSTDDSKIIEVVENYGLKVPFRRPDELATDNSGTYEVLLHAVEHYKSKDILYKKIVLLQPTSPFRTQKHIEDALKLYSAELDMVVSVRESPSNPYYSLFEENNQGLLEKSKTGNYERRQDIPKVYEYNGAVYIINISSLICGPLYTFQKVKKYEMSSLCSIDLDTALDWEWAEFLKNKGIMEV